MFSCTGNLSKVENQNIAQKEKLILQQPPGCEKIDQNRGKDNYQEVTHPAYRCRLCGKFPVSLCKSCDFNFCKKCKVQHPHTPKNVNAALPHNEKDHQRSPKIANFQDIQKFYSRYFITLHTSSNVQLDVHVYIVPFT